MLKLPLHPNSQLEQRRYLQIQLYIWNKLRGRLWPGIGVYTLAPAPHIHFSACVQCQYKIMELSLHVDLSESILEDTVEQLLHPFTSDRTLEGLLFALETLLTYIVQIESLETTLQPTAMGALNDLIDATRELTQSAEELVNRQRRLHRQQLRRGRPKLQITEDQLRELLQAHFSVVSIA